MRSNRILLGVATGLLLVLSVSATEPIEPGLSRDDLIAKHGKPISSVGKGARELLTYPDGRVTVENGVVTRFEATTTNYVSTTSTPAATAAAPDPLQPRVDPRAAKAGWLSNMDEAIAKATAENKPILFLFSGNLDQCPWGKKFNEVVEYSDQFVRRIRSDYVPLRINISELGGNFEASSKEDVDRMAEKFEAFTKMREQVFSTQMLPSMAILSSDGKGATEVDMTGALEAMMQGRLNEYTLSRMAVARDGPRKEIKAYTSSAGKRKLLYLVGGLVVVVVLIKKIAS